MTFVVYKEISYNKTLYAPADSNSIINFVLVHNTDVINTGFVYDITIYWLNEGVKRCFLQARHKENLLNNPNLLTALFNDNKLKFPLNAECGWKDSKIDEKDKKFLGV